MYTTIRPKVRVLINLFIYLYTIIRPKIRVLIDLLFYLHTTIRRNYLVLFHLYSFDQILGSSLIYFFHLHTTIRQKYMTFLSFILSLWATIRPEISVLVNLFLSFVHDHSTKFRRHSYS